MKKIDSITNPVTGETKQIVVKGLWRHWEPYLAIGLLTAITSTIMTHCYRQGVIDHINEEFGVLKELDLIDVK